MFFQDVILTLQNYWAEQGCVILQPYDMQMGAGTFHTGTFLRALGASRRDVGLTLVTEHALVTGGGSLAGLVAGTATAVLAVAASPVPGAPAPVVAVDVGVPWAWLVLATVLLVAVPLLALRLVRGGSREAR